MITAICIAIVALGLLSLLCGAVLSYCASRWPVTADPIVEQIDDLLPQSQCGQCGYIGCRPYAEAIAGTGEAINKCVPGGERTMRKLAALLNVDAQAMDSATSTAPSPVVAWIDEANCIGCTKCIHACPVDAIIGTTRAMHTVLSDLCTGCELCVAPCPTDCIVMHPVMETPTSWRWRAHAIPITEVTVSHHV